jgi:hypothetical protein
MIPPIPLPLAKSSRLKGAQAVNATTISENEPPHLLHFRTGHGFFSRPPGTLLPSSVINSAPVNRKKSEITFFDTAHGITEHESNSSKLSNSLQMTLRCHHYQDTSIPQATKKSLYNRWDARIKVLNTDKDGKDTNLKALKLVRRFIKDCGYLDRRCCPVDPFLVRP